MTQVIIKRAPEKSNVYCYDNVTKGSQVNATLHEIIKEFKMTMNVWVISGTHGADNGTVDPTFHTPDFRLTDIDNASATCKNIHVLDYHQLSAKRWAELSGKSGKTNVIVLAFCYSSLWFMCLLLETTASCSPLFIL